MNGDNFPELVEPGDDKGALHYYENDSFTKTSMNFRGATLYYDFTCLPREDETVDIDGDSTIDIVAAIYDTSVDKTDKIIISSSGCIFRQKY